MCLDRWAKSSIARPKLRRGDSKFRRPSDVVRAERLLGQCIVCVSFAEAITSNSLTIVLLRIESCVRLGRVHNQEIKSGAIGLPLPHLRRGRRRLCGVEAFWNSFGHDLAIYHMMIGEGWAGVVPPTAQTVGSNLWQQAFARLKARAKPVLFEAAGFTGFVVSSR